MSEEYRGTYLGLRWLLEAHIVVLDDSVRMSTYLFHLLIPSDVDDAACAAIERGVRVILKRLIHMLEMLVLRPRMELRCCSFFARLLLLQRLCLPILAATARHFRLLLAEADPLPVLDVELLPGERRVGATRWLLRRVLHYVAELGVHVQRGHVVREDLRPRRAEGRRLVGAG